VKLQANGPEAVARRRAVDYTRARTEISLERTQVQSVVRLPGRPSKDANAVAADVVGNAKLRRQSRIDAAQIHVHSDEISFFGTFPNKCNWHVTPPWMAGLVGLEMYQGK